MFILPCNAGRTDPFLASRFLVAFCIHKDTHSLHVQALDFKDGQSFTRSAHTNSIPGQLPTSELCAYLVADTLGTVTRTHGVLSFPVKGQRWFLEAG